MSLVLILGDTHLGYSSSHQHFHSFFRKFYKFMFEYMNKNNIKTLIQLGDLFDNKREVKFSTIKEANEYFFTPIKEYNIKTYVISGNHDITHKNTSDINSVSLLCPDYVTVIDKKPKTIEIESALFDFYPWINESNATESINIAKNTKSNYALGHFEFSGFPMYPGTIAETGMDSSIFSKYDIVFSGHFHTISTKANILYTGTPYELNWTDCGDIKGFWVLDTKTGKKEHIKNPYSMYEKISYTDDIDYIFSNVKDKIVRVNVIDKKDQKKFDSFISNIQHNNPISYIISDTNIQESVENSVQNLEVLSTKTMIENVVDTLDLNLDKKILKKYILEIYNDAMSLTKL